MALPASQLAALEETIDAVRRLLDGERITVSGRHVTLDDVQLVFPPTPRPPIVVGVTGPKGIDLTARVVRTDCCSRKGRARRSSRPRTNEWVALRSAWCTCCSRSDDDGAAARERVARSVDSFAPGPIDDRLAKLGVVEHVDDVDRVERYAVAGTPADCARSIDALIAAGATSVVVVPRTRSGADQDDQVRRLVTEVAPLLSV